MGDVYARLKLWDKAQQEFRTALQLNPALATAYVKLGDLLRQQGKLDHAKQAYEQALRTNDKCLVGYIGLAQLCFALKKPEEAQPLIDMAVQIAPDNAAALAFAGEMARQRGMLAAAEAVLKSALKKDPYSPDALWSLAACVQALGREDEAEKL